ncbi:hypothetical protein [Ramlibacter pallidus]|uniref:Uncharacterized protein n=1 Tax=Ramlibacter pallidus TaxID=2780087 RepID=A0ABR9RZ05_9BURK|nr:hypothetical protein [Ramlibacter pallidus]MBE7366491.1 hypothetical protein [Ramlibacter pallidus]
MHTASEAFRKARPGPFVIGWKLDREERELLLARFPPAYARPIADHVTLRPRVHAGTVLPPAVRAVIVGRADDGQGLEALVVHVDGSTERPGGGTYHVTWSLEAGRKAVESNDVIAARGWQPVDPPVALQLVPARFR